MVYYIVGSLLLVATITDIFWRRIPNILVLIYFVSGIFILHSDFLIRFCISLVIFSALYRLRFFGAGDVKLFSLIIGFLGVYYIAIV
ncbi:MAG: prepilin peptidase, partial [Lachnospiraceae bacterium oral taxon 082]|nr:prepilin peptidase [Lachnospiraceae bacterium oral taxon 082]